MKRQRLAILGLGKIGKACGEAILASADFELAGLVRRPETVAKPAPDSFKGIPRVADTSELSRLDGVLICVPTNLVLTSVQALLQRRLPIVECATLHGAAFAQHKQSIDRAARRHRVPAIVGAGWDPGFLSLLRALFTLAAPKGATTTTERPGLALHHSASAQAVVGVRRALCTELSTAAGRIQRYCYVELDQGADVERVTTAIRNDPLFLDQDTFVFPVDSVAALEDSGHGVVIERRGTAGRTAHQAFVLDARFDLPATTAQVMIAAARTLPSRSAGAHSLIDIPLDHFWDEARDRAEDFWI
jgi:diaminopimelate dehydrogenase